jgi:hypothetical protein
MKKKKVWDYSFLEFRLLVSLGHTDDDRFVETSIQIRQAQGTFPSAFGVAVYLLVEMLEDEDTLAKGATGLLNE